MESFTHLPLQVCLLHFLGLAHSSSNSYTSANPGHVPPSKLKTCLSPLACAFNANVPISDLYVRCEWTAAARTVQLHCFPHQTSEGGRQGLCLPTRLKSRHQPLGSPSCMTFTQKLHSFVSRFWPGATPWAWNACCSAPLTPNSKQAAKGALRHPSRTQFKCHFLQEASPTSRLKCLALCSRGTQWFSCRAQ